MLLDPIGRVGGTAAPFLMLLVRSVHLRVVGSLRDLVSKWGDVRHEPSSPRCVAMIRKILGVGIGQFLVIWHDVATSTAGIASVRSWGAKL